MNKKIHTKIPIQPHGPLKPEEEVWGTTASALAPDSRHLAFSNRSTYVVVLRLDPSKLTATEKPRERPRSK